MVKIMCDHVEKGFTLLQISKGANSHNVNLKLMVMKQAEETIAQWHKNFTLPK
jgi:hypothetical protein